MPLSDMLTDLRVKTGIFQGCAKRVSTSIKILHLFLIMCDLAVIQIEIDEETKTNCLELLKIRI